MPIALSGGLPEVLAPTYGSAAATFPADSGSCSLLARVLVFQPEILVMDEATSSVDTETEALIQDALERVMRDRTCLLIAHRLSTIRNADRIIVLHRGEVREIRFSFTTDGEARHLSSAVSAAVRARGIETAGSRSGAQDLWVVAGVGEFYVDCGNSFAPPTLLSRAFSWSIIAGLMLSSMLSGCSPIYFLRAAYEEGRILWRRQPIADFLATPDLHNDTKEKLTTVLAVRDYAQKVLNLNVAGSYASYSYVDRPDLTYLVIAAPQTELRPYTWWFLVVGHVPYKGFFS